MTSAGQLFAGLAGALAVAGAWEALAAVEQAAVARGAARLLGPLRAAGREGREPSAPEMRRLALLGAASLLAGGALLAGPLVGAAAAAAGPWAVRRLLAFRRARWRAALGGGAPAPPRAMADAPARGPPLRGAIAAAATRGGLHRAGGHAVRGAIAAAATGGGLDGAVAAELRDAARAFELGERTDVVLERLRTRAADPRWDTIVAAVLLQRDAGGDLARLLRTIAAAQEDAARVEADARGLTAQARVTAWLVTLPPARAPLPAQLAQPGHL